MEWRLDYIEREIQKLSLILNTIFKTLTGPNPGLPQEVSVSLVQEQLLSWEQQTDEALLKAITENPAFILENIKLLAHIYYEKYQNNPTHTAARKKALLLYQFFAQQSENTLDFTVYQRIQLLQTDKN